MSSMILLDLRVLFRKVPAGHSMVPIHRLFPGGNVMVYFDRFSKSCANFFYKSTRREFGINLFGSFQVIKKNST